MDLTNLPHPIAVFVRGLPGSGKSYLTERLARAIGPDLVVVLDPDAIPYDSTEYQAHVAQQTEEGVDPALHAYRFSRAKAYQAVADHKIIIWNQPFTNLEIFNKMVGRLQDQATEHQTTLPVLVTEVQIDPAQARNRVTARKAAGGHGPDDATFERFVHDYASFASEGYDVITIDGEADADESVAAILSRLETLAA